MPSSDDTTTLPVPPLQNGDHLTRPEFERRYEAMPPGAIAKAELIDGIVHIILSVRAESHARPTNVISTWLGLYDAATSGVQAYDNATVRLDLDNEVQPDVLLRIEESWGGQSRISADDYIEGPPELVVEIAASSAAYDLHSKKNLYRRSGLQEYLVWQVFDERLDWFVLEEGAYLSLEPDAEEGLLKSRAFPGLHLPAQALLEGDMMAVLEAVRAGTTTDAHAAFVERLST